MSSMSSWTSRDDRTCRHGQRPHQTYLPGHLSGHDEVLRDLRRGLLRPDHRRRIAPQHLQPLPRPVRLFRRLQIGLTATPVNYIARNTYRLFDCEERHPTAYYPLEQAVEDEYLVPFEVYHSHHQVPCVAASSIHSCPRSSGGNSKRTVKIRRPSTTNTGDRQADLQQGHQPRDSAQPDGERHSRCHRPASGQDHHLCPQPQPRRPARRTLRRDVSAVWRELSARSSTTTIPGPSS